MAENKSTSASAPKTTAANPSNLSGSSMFTFFIILAALGVAFLIFYFLLGNGKNFAGNNSDNEPLNLLGRMFKGGIVVPFLICFLLTTVLFSIERFLTIMKASGSGSIQAFVRNIKVQLEAGNLAAAKASCEKQRGSVANVVKAALEKYGEMESNTTLSRDQKVLAIKKEVEEATALELPMLEKNLPIIATSASIATLGGLFGTVIGMIRSFSAMANAGAPDATALSTGISEALINTALGILTSAISIVLYNYFTSSIDDLNYEIEEVGFTITQSFASKN
jgi:biopolymer transport protein ExbB